ncbi:nuclear transport factor 2 family protein [Oceanicaulis sp. LC35]|uniref:nuclear transport factor 2 family protein n=1 Tax=Oceanicaulis sp. LC35 TaxID=3349635 RepID=UPI003F859F91
MTIVYPNAVKRYMTAQNPEDIASCFTEDGVVTDERQSHHGRAAILKWRQDVQAINFKERVLSAEGDDAAVTLTCEVSGAFKNSPILFTYRFVLSDGLIQTLEILDEV